MDLCFEKYFKYILKLQNYKVNQKSLQLKWKVQPRSLSKKCRKKSWDSQKSNKNQEILSNWHQTQRVGRVGTRLTVSPLVIRTGTRAKLKPPAQRKSMIWFRRITEFDFFLIVTWTYVLKKWLKLYESFKVVKLLEKVLSKNESVIVFHLEKNVEKKLRFSKKSQKSRNSKQSTSDSTSWPSGDQVDVSSARYQFEVWSLK